MFPIIPLIMLAGFIYGVSQIKVVKLTAKQKKEAKKSGGMFFSLTDKQQKDFKK